MNSDTFSFIPFFFLILLSSCQSTTNMKNNQTLLDLTIENYHQYSWKSIYPKTMSKARENRSNQVRITELEQKIKVAQKEYYHYQDLQKATQILETN